MGRLSLETRVERFRKLCFDGVRAALRVPGKHCRSYECAVQLFFPSYAESLRGKGRYRLAMSCSLLGRGNHHAWSGESWQDVFSLAGDDVKKWIADVERDLGEDE